MKEKIIEVRAAKTQRAVLEHQCDLVNDFETVAQAKQQARRYLTDDYQKLSEASEPLRYAQVVVNGECVADYFRKGYNGDEDKEN